MKVPKNFKTRIAGNFYSNTPDLVVCDDTTILRVERAQKTGRLKVKLRIFGANGRRRATVEDTEITRGRRKDFSVRMTDNNYSVKENSTGRVVCKLQKCGAARPMDIDAFVTTYAPDGFLIHASPVQTNLGTKSTGELYRDRDCALSM